METPAYVVNVDVAVVRSEEYLFIKRAASESHAAGLLGFPGGTVEQSTGGERTIERTATRELEEEEVGVDVEDVEYVHSNTFEADDGTPCLNVLTLANYAGGEAHPKAQDEVAAVHWLTAEELRARDEVPEFTERYVDLVEAQRTEAA